MTFTVLAVSPSAAIMCAAVASRSLAVGNSVLALDPAVGLVASQAWTNRALRAYLLDELASGTAPRDAIAAIPRWDAQPELRQIAVIGLDGTPATHTGSQVTGWAGAITRPGLVAIGNLLTGPEVLAAIVADYDRSPAQPAAPAEQVGALARRVLAAMHRGEQAGGDRRGKQSAALVAAVIAPERRHPAELAIDLRVDDDPEPLARLSQLLELRLAD